MGLAFISYCRAQDIIKKPSTNLTYQDSVELLSKEWLLVEHDVCDRCHPHVPGDTMLAVFKDDFTCYGDGLKINVDSKMAKWSLSGEKLIIAYNDKSTMTNKQMFYDIRELNKNTLVLVHQAYFGDAKSKFKPFNP